MKVAYSGPYLAGHNPVRMRLRRFALRRAAIAISLVWSVAQTGIRAQAIADWSTVTALQPRTRITVDAPTRIQGFVDHADADRLVVQVDGQLREFRRASVLRVAVIGPRQSGRRARNGLIIGAASGAVLGAVTAETNKGVWSALMALGWGAFGAAIGAINGLGRPETTIYEVRPVSGDTKLCSPERTDQPTSGSSTNPRSSSRLIPLNAATPCNT